MTRTALPLRSLVIALLLLRLPLAAQEQGPSSTSRSSLSLELDPAPFLLNGYSFSVRHANSKVPHWSLMASVYSADMPDRMISAENRDAGWSDLRLAPSFAVFADRTFREDGRGFYFGPSVFLYDNRVTHAPSGTALAFRSIYPNIRLGYTWFPFRGAQFYFSPWLNVGTELALDATGTDEVPAYELENVKYIVALHLGYRAHW